jgi:hypothetical protein
MLRVAMALVDESEWPLVAVNWPDGQLSDGVVDEALGALAGFYGRRHAVLHDGLRVLGLGLAQRRRMMQHAAAYQEDIRRSVVASAAVVQSAWGRGIIRVMQQVSPPVEPFRICAARPEAEQWLQQALRRAGLWRPSATRLA